MRLLLDTHVLLWMAERSRRLGKKAGALVVDPDSELWLSSVSVFEIANKVARNRLRISQPIAKWLLSKLRENDISSLAIAHEHAIAAAELPRYHEDPFDRILIGQAQVEDLRIVTADAQFERYDVRLIDATV
ncbi:MAG: type II toxin-antitoxin system VapC family toxin [Candidatus Binataceae bacterium]